MVFMPTLWNSAFICSGVNGELRSGGGITHTYLARGQRLLLRPDHRRARKRYCIPNSPERVTAIGPGAVLTTKHKCFYINEYQEFSAQNRATGPKLVLGVMRVF